MTLRSCAVLLMVTKTVLVVTGEYFMKKKNGSFNHSNHAQLQCAVTGATLCS